MSTKKIFLIFIIIGLTSFFMGCTAPDNKMNADKKPIVGGVAVGISPKVIYAERGENVTFNVYLQSTENTDDMITVGINGTWINMTIIQNILAGENRTLPVYAIIPKTAENMSFKVRALSQNFKVSSSTSGVIIIKDRSK